MAKIPTTAGSTDAPSADGKAIPGEAPGRGDSDRLPQSVMSELQRLSAKPLAIGLYVVATPIGNLGDITLRALTTLAAADVIYCEDTRHSRILLAHFGISTPLRPYHEHNAERERPRIVGQLKDGKRLALISDAGTPLVSDPGYKLVRAIIEAGYDVTALPGPSAVLAAIASAGLPTDSFFFAGFLPPKETARKKRLAGIASIPATLVFYEAPSRLAACLTDIAEVLGGRDAVVARELTKLHEELRRGTPEELAAWAADKPPKGEMVILVGPPGVAEVTDGQITARLVECLNSMSLRDAAKAIADELKVAKTRAYDLGLALKKSRED